MQGLFLPALTTCLAAYLAKEPGPGAAQFGHGLLCLSHSRGRRPPGPALGRLAAPPLHWRYAFVTASLLLLAS
ncbi:hypothetical protein DFAR_2560003 [Desulfarculales bacterium]